VTAVPRGSPADRSAPGRPYRQVERRTLLGTAAVLVGLAAAAWWATVDTAADMAAMVGGLADVGRAMPFRMSALLFMSMWVTMMVAMMLPTVGPIVALHRMVLRRRGAGLLPTVVFVGGYLVVWAATGVVPLLALVASRQVTEPSAWADRAAGVVLVVAGAYQFTRWKDTCLRACRSPMTFLATHDFGSGRLGAFRAGASHGLYCAGCCWALMAVLFVVGLMNLAWMAAIAVVFLAEKTWRHGVGLTRVVGTGVLVLGLVVLVDPSLLGALGSAGSGAGTSPDPGM
jgi:predicted metal-binding membrane protein